MLAVRGGLVDLRRRWAERAAVGDRYPQLRTGARITSLNGASGHLLAGLAQRRARAPRVRGRHPQPVPHRPAPRKGSRSRGACARSLAATRDGRRRARRPRPIRPLRAPARHRPGADRGSPVRRIPAAPGLRRPPRRGQPERGSRPPPRRARSRGRRARCRLGDDQRVGWRDACSRLCAPSCLPAMRSRVQIPVGEHRSESTGGGGRTRLTPLGTARADRRARRSPAGVWVRRSRSHRHNDVPRPACRRWCPGARRGSAPAALGKGDGRRLVPASQRGRARSAQREARADRRAGSAHRRRSRLGTRFAQGETTATGRPAGQGSMSPRRMA
jgi:hypothetical protein